MARSTKDETKYEVIRDHASKDFWEDLYHRLLVLPWTHFLLLFVVGHLLVNLGFAFLYTLQEDSIAHARSGSLLDAFFFSVQTISTVGYGEMAPQTVYANLVASIEIIVGLISIGVMGGMVFAKFARPTARVLFSEKALVTQLDGVPTFMFRVANARSNQIVDAQVTVTLSRLETSAEGVPMRRFYEIPLVRKHSPLFALTWTVMHTVDEQSPLKGLTEDVFRNSGDEVFVTLRGTDGTFSQMIHARYIYGGEKIQWGGHYENVLFPQENRVVRIDFSKFHNVVKS